ncbi:glycosyltransferase family 39 protein [Spirulina subsalsa FACHB-351]|uniref:Glycosyltransferase family 39 protein n=1 Tax=Spirulina subsalsa FACHB-351 TaxID=234711 RepID=A0ABT3L983_9CYAN|nr:glycosyltransferase family 39 protein [Spirulina subsalsa]MCW6037707.1 glycosyltransferase family 39 protein [Spirulina subsalsa FACHB-351]
MHYLILTLILTFGAVLRFWRLESKPLWVDEVITAIFSLGQSFQTVPVNQVLSLTDVQNVLRLNPEASCLDIAQTLATESTHPPLFFCLLHESLVALQGWGMPLEWQLRALSAFFGVVAIATLYLLNRLAFDQKAALLGASVMAVSPFAVYLSQEARHYTFPLVLITLSLCYWVKICQDIQQQHPPRLGLWLGWGCTSVLSLYSHYFGALALVAQGLTLLLVMYQHRDLMGKIWPSFVWPGLVFCLPFTLLLPWLPLILAHSTSPKTSWLGRPDLISPVTQTVAGWTVFVVSLPVENQPLWVQIPAALLTLVCVIWVIQATIRRLRRLKAHPSVFLLLSYIFWVLLQFFFIIYGLGKDISIAPRYNFVYFPALCALLGVAFTVVLKDLPQALPKASIRLFPLAAWLLLGLGIVSSLCTVYDLAFQKPYAPAPIAQQFTASGEKMLFIMAYFDTLTLAVGLSYGLALKRLPPPQPTLEVALMTVEEDYGTVWPAIAQLSTHPEIFWFMAPGMVKETYPPELVLAHQIVCVMDDTEYHRLGFPYQLYRCPPLP